MLQSKYLCTKEYITQEHSSGNAGLHIQGSYSSWHGTGYQTKFDDFMTINRISIGKMTLMFSCYFNFNVNISANSW